MSYNQKTRILTDLQKCNYIPTMKDLVCNTIMEIMNSKLKKEQAKYYIRQWQKDNIIMIWLPMIATLQGKYYSVPIQIYLPKNYPHDGPLIYLEVGQGCGINQKNPNIIMNTKQIIVPSLQRWTLTTSISTVLSEINASFSKDFPIFKITSNQNQMAQNNMMNNPKPNTFFGVLNNGINQLAAQSGYSFSGGVSIYGQPMNSNNNMNNAYNNNNNLFNNSINNNIKPGSNVNIYNAGNSIYQTEPPDVQLKKILINHFIENNLQKIKDERNKLTQQESKLRNYQNEFKLSNDKINNFMNNQGNILNSCQNDINNLNNEILKINSYNQNRQGEGLTRDNFMNFIQVSNTKGIALIAKEAYLEELLIFVKKSFEKNNINILDAVKLIRNNSRTLFEVRFLREKNTSPNYMI